MKLVLSLVAILLVSTTSWASQENNFFQLEGTQIEVLNHDGNPIIGATVMIGFAENDPFQGNIFITNSLGSVDIPAIWKSPLPVTVTADGYLATTYSDSHPLGRTLILENAESEESFEFKGEVKGFGELRRDGKVDVGFVMPAFTMRELLGFDISSVMSPETDTIKVLNRSVEIPSNLSLPRQTESYIFPFTLNKPSFRIYSRTEGLKKFVAGHVQFPVKRVVDKLRDGQSILEVINDFKFLGGGKKDVQMSSSSSQGDMNVDEFRYDDIMTVTGVDLPVDKIMLSVAVKKDGEHFFPTDIKYVESGQQMDLSTLSVSENSYVASMFTNKPEEKPSKSIQWVFNQPQFVSPLNFMDLFVAEQKTIAEAPSLNQMSITLQKYSEGLNPPQFLSLVSAPVLADGEIQISPPEAMDNVTPIGTILVYSRIESIAQEGFESEKRTRLWEIFAPNWANRVSIPEIETPTSENISHRWEVIFLGKEVGSSDMEGLNAITHISRNSISID